MKRKTVLVCAVISLGFFHCEKKAGAFYQEPLRSYSNFVASVIESTSIEGKDNSEKLKEMMYNHAIWKSPLHAVSLLATRGENRKFLQKRIQLSVEICPDCHEVLYLLGKVCILDLKDYQRGLMFFVKGWWYSVLESLKTGFFLGPVLKAFFYSVIFTTLYVFLLSLFLNLKKLNHFIEHWFNTRATTVFSLLLVLVLTLIPVLVGFGMDIAAYIILMISLIWVSSSTRKSIGIIAFILAVTPVIRYASRQIFNFVNDPRVRVYYKYEKYMWDDEFQKGITRVSQDSNAFTFLKALYNFKQGKYLQASSIFKTLSEKSSEAQYLVNYGVSQWALGNLEDAKDAFESAIRVNPSLASAHYNLAQYYYKKAIPEKAEKELAISRNLNSSEVDFINAIFEKNHPERSLIIEEKIDFSYWKVLLEYLLSSSQLTSLLFENSTGTSGLVYTLGFLIIFLIVRNMVDRSFKYSIPVLACHSCGDPFCINCLEIGSEEEGYCNLCYSIFIKKKSADIEAKRKKEAQIESYRRRKKLLTQSLGFVPGIGHVFLDLPLRAFFYTFLIFWMVLLLIFREQIEFSPIPYSMIITPGDVFIVLIIAIVYTIYMLDLRASRG